MRSPVKILSVLTLIAMAPVSAACSDPLRPDSAAFARGNYVHAARLLAPQARRGYPRASAMLGFMYENGLGVPQSYDIAAELYARAAEGGDASGQHLLGLLYDKGHGVDQDDVLAYKWLSLAASAAPARERDYYLRIRDAVASKMSLDQIMAGQRLALDWRPRAQSRGAR